MLEEACRLFCAMSAYFTNKWVVVVVIDSIFSYSHCRLLAGFQIIGVELHKIPNTHNRRTRQSGCTTYRSIHHRSLTHLTLLIFQSKECCVHLANVHLSAEQWLSVVWMKHDVDERYLQDAEPALKEEANVNGLEEDYFRIISHK